MTILDLETPTEVEAADHKLRDLPQAENSSITDRPADPEAARVISTLLAAHLAETHLARGYIEMSAELLEWSETALPAQAEVLPEE